VVRGCPARHSQQNLLPIPRIRRFKILTSGVPLETETTPAHFPRPAYQQQDAQFRAAFEVLNAAIADRAFPACSVAITRDDQLIALKALGRFSYESSSPEVVAGTIFDIASVTKVVSTTTVAMILYERGVLDLEMALPSIVPEFLTGDPRRENVTLRMLLAHSSGLPAYKKLFLSAKSKDDFLHAAMTSELVADPGSTADYSDIGFILLGIAIERLADEPLDRFAQREIFGPLGMIHTSFNPSPAIKPSIVPTANDQSFRHRILQGEVQDENASIMQGVAGHAGLFSNAGDLAIFSNAMLSGGPPILRAQTLNIFTRRESAPAGTCRALGWDTPSSPSQSGQYFSEHSFGHLGYTGTSLWIDPERQLSVTLLTNRTWPDCRNQVIKLVRPKFHDAVIEALEAER
jgi:serine-type D-Ala-D-Ala carboxypeptidase